MDECRAKQVVQLAGIIYDTVTLESTSRYIGQVPNYTYAASLLQELENTWGDLRRQTIAAALSTDGDGDADPGGPDPASPAYNPPAHLSVASFTSDIGQMNTNKRQRNDDQDRHVPTRASPVAVRTLKLKLCAELASKLGTRYCNEEELLMLMVAHRVYSRTETGGLKLCLADCELATMLGGALSTFSPRIREEEVVTLMLSKMLCSRVLTFEVRATRMGDLNGDWITITLEDGRASTADVKEGMERVKGIKPAMQELFWYEESWTGTKASGGSGHTEEQEGAALLEEGYVFEGPCSVVVSVNELYDVVLEGQEEGELKHELMGVYERMEGKEMNGKGVWQKLGMEHFLYYCGYSGWIVSRRRHMETVLLFADDDGHVRAAVSMKVKSTAATPEEITEGWEIINTATQAWENTPKLRVRVCSSVEKHAAVERVEQEQEQALEEAQQRRRLVLEGLTNDRWGAMGMCALMEGKVVNGRAVWQQQRQDSGGDKEIFVYYVAGKWLVSERRDDMEVGAARGIIFLSSTALTPDQHGAAEVWRIPDGTGTFVENAEVRIRRQA
jgi:hypothetical protein